MIKAGCHCGAVRLEIARRPRSLTQCNCSICRRYGALWAYYTRSGARVTSSPAALKGYQWGDRTIRFLHCRTCGCLTHYEGVSKEGGDRMAVNARIMDPEDILAVRIRRFDGADTWKYLPDNGQPG